MAPLLLLLSGALIWSGWPRDQIVHTSVAEALRNYRARSEGEDSARRGLPPPGVYVYSIAGSETLSASVLDGTHRYDGRVTITVEPTPCGVSELWQPLDSRWSKSGICARGGRLRLAAMSEAHEFFGRSSLDSYSCRGTAPALAEYRVGARWTSVCSGRTGSLRITSRIIAEGEVEVGGRQLAAVRIRSRATISGDSSGVSIQSEWRRRTDGLLLRRSVRTEALVDVLGGGTYSEGYSLQLLSADPRR